MSPLFYIVPLSSQRHRINDLYMSIIFYQKMSINVAAFKYEDVFITMKSDLVISLKIR